IRISPVLLDEVRLEGRSDFVGRLQRVVDGPVSCGVVNHAASIAYGPVMPGPCQRHQLPLLPRRRQGWRPGRVYVLTLLEPSRDDRTLGLILQQHFVIKVRYGMPVS